jgi:hypothetical protein
MSPLFLDSPYRISSASTTYMHTCLLRATGTINEQDLPELRKKMDEVEVDNETVHWNCQDYVIEAIDHLREECIIDEDDEDYERGRKDAVENHYGPR